MVVSRRDKIHLNLDELYLNPDGLHLNSDETQMNDEFCVITKLTNCMQVYGGRGVPTNISLKFSSF